MTAEATAKPHGVCKCGHGPESHMKGAGVCIVSDNGVPVLCGCDRYWRASWAAPPPTRGRARTAAEIRERAMQRLADLSEQDEAPNAAVQATKALLEQTEPNIRKLLLKLLEGDEDRLESWLRAELAECEARREKR